MPYRGAEHVVVVSVSASPRPGILSVTLPSGKIISIEKTELDLLRKCGMAEEVP